VQRRDASTSCPGLRCSSMSPQSTQFSLGIFTDKVANLMMRTHVQKTVYWCFVVLKQLPSVCHTVPMTTFQTLIILLVPSRLDYGNAVLVDHSAYLLHRLQSLMNAAARLSYGLRHSDHISRKQRRILPQLGQRSPVATTSAFHWLKAPILGHLICIIGIGSTVR